MHKIRFKFIYLFSKWRPKWRLESLVGYITEPFINRFGSNLNCMRSINFQKITINKFHNGGQDGDQDGGPKL